MASSLKLFQIKGLLIITFISVTWVNLNQERWVKKDVIAHDIVNYNSYLPALFYEHDLSLSFLSDTVNQALEKKLYAPNVTTGYRPVIKMTMGMAISYLPFFGLAHLYCKLFNFPANGFSEPYHFALLFSSLFYYLIGLIFLYRILLRYFEDRIAVCVLFLLTFGTNIFYYLTNAAALAHTLGFAFYSIFLYLTLLWYHAPRKSIALLLGLIGGYLVLVRPTNVLIIVFFILYDIKTTEDLRTRTRFFARKKLHLLLMVVVAFLLWIPQLLYWKYSTGHFFFNSYIDEHFYFKNPHIFKAIFGFRKGWLIYTPIMFFALAGFYFLRKQLKEYYFPLIVFLMVYIYVMFSWWCWWYGGTFGQRVMIEVYSLLAIPFCALMTYLKDIRLKKRLVAYSIMGFFVFLNLFQSIQAKYNILHYDSMTMRNYFEIFFTMTTKPDREQYLDHPDYKKAKSGEDE